MMTVLTVSEWEVEIQRILLGEREWRIQQLGSIEEYIESILFTSHDQALARTNFRQALRLAIEEWNPADASEPEYIDGILDFVLAYRPSGGTSKLLELLRTTELGGVDQSNLRSESYELVEKSLAALEGYFPSAPSPSEEKAADFKAYLAFLRLETKTIAGSTYATRRLLQLGATESPGEVLQKLIEHHSITDLVAVSLAPNPPIQPALILGSLYVHCLQTNKVHEFIENLDGYEGKIVDYGGGLAIIIPGRPHLQLDLPPKSSEQVQEAFMKYRWSAADDRGFEKLHSIVN